MMVFHSTSASLLLLSCMTCFLFIFLNHIRKSKLELLNMDADEQLARQLQAEENQRAAAEAQAQAQAQARSQPDSRLEKAFSARLRSGVATARTYEDQMAQAMALSCVPVGDIEKRAREQLEKADNKLSFMDARVVALLKWFKSDFFSWCNSPKCPVCGDAGKMKCTGMAQPTPDDVKYGASRVELHSCANWRKRSVSEV